MSVLSLANMVFCAAIVWCCVCVLNSPRTKRWKVVGVRFSLLLTGALMSGAQPLLFGDSTSPGEVMLSAVLAVCMLVDVARRGADERCGRCRVCGRVGDACQ